MEPLEHLRVVRQRWSVVVLAFLLTVGAAAVTTPRRPVDAPPPTRMFTATHTLIRDAATPGSPDQLSLDLLALFATTGVIPPRVVDRLELDVDPAVLAARMSVTADASVGTLTVSTRDSDGEQAALLANTFAEEILAYITEQAETTRQAAIAATQERLANQQERIRQLDARLAGLAPGSTDAELAQAERDALLQQYRVGLQRVEQLNAEPADGGGLYTLQTAVPVPVPDTGFQPPSTPGVRLAAGAGVGLVLGLVLAFGLNRFDTRVRTRRGAERAFGLPVVAEVPRLPRRWRRGRKLVVVARPATFAAEAYRMLRLALQIMPRWVLPAPVPARTDSEAAAPPAQDVARRAGHGPPRVILVTSAAPREGKTSTVANLAASFAEAGKAVLTLDCDFRHPELHAFLGVEQGPGVSNYLTDRDRHPSLAALVRETGTAGVRTVTSGTATDRPGELLARDQDVLSAAARLADVVIVDSGPLLAVKDAAALVPHVDAVVLVARSGQTTAEIAHRTREYLARLAAPVLGVALVGVPRSAVGGRRYQAAPVDGGRSRAPRVPFSSGLDEPAARKHQE